MQDNQWRRQFLKIASKYGLTGALLNVVALLVLYQIEANPVLTNTLAGIVVLILFVFFAIKEFKDVHNQKQLHFWQGLILGTATYLVIAVVSSSFYYVYINHINTDILMEIKQTQREFLEKEKEEMVTQRGEDWYEETYLMIEEITAGNLAWDDFFRKALIGIFVTIIISVILRKVPQEYI